MAKVLCINDFILYSEMIAMMIREKGGHDVKADIVPIDVQEIHAFDPDVIVLNIFRKNASLDRPIMDFYAEVEGARAFKFLSQWTDAFPYPILITAMAVEERDIPKELNYLSFVEVPHKLESLLHIIDRLPRSGDKLFVS